jgi:hypothetical protein
LLARTNGHSGYISLQALALVIAKRGSSIRNEFRWNHRFVNVASDAG